MELKKEKMDPYFSVFNSHVNNAHDRAMEVMKRSFKSHYAKIKKAEAKGIMSIFDTKPAQATLIYVALVTAFVNEY